MALEEGENMLSDYLRAIQLHNRVIANIEKINNHLKEIQKLEQENKETLENIEFLKRDYYE